MHFIQLASGRGPHVWNDVFLSSSSFSSAKKKRASKNNEVDVCHLCMCNVNSRQTNYPQIKHTHITRTINANIHKIPSYNNFFFFFRCSSIVFPFAPDAQKKNYFSLKHFIKSRQTVKLMPNSWRIRIISKIETTREQ